MKEELSVWSLIKNGEFEDACEKANKEYLSTGDILCLRNKVYALFHLRKYTDVISLTEKLIENRKGETDTDLLSLGIANWIVGNRTQAIEAWQRAQNSLYKDAAGGVEIQVFLYFSGIKTNVDKLKSNAVKVIKKIQKSKRSINWPGPLGRYLLNEITESELFTYIASVPILRERQSCQAYFLSAIKRLESGDTEGYYQKLKDCVSYGPFSYLEQMYYIAKGELEIR